MGFVTEQTLRGQDSRVQGSLRVWNHIRRRVRRDHTERESPCCSPVLGIRFFYSRRCQLLRGADQKKGDSSIVREKARREGIRKDSRRLTHDTQRAADGRVFDVYTRHVWKGRAAVPVRCWPNLRATSKPPRIPLGASTSIPHGEQCAGLSKSPRRLGRHLHASQPGIQRHPNGGVSHRLSGSQRSKLLPRFPSKKS